MKKTSPGSGLDQDVQNAISKRELQSRMGRALEIIDDALESENEQLAVATAKYIIDQSVGKASQEIVNQGGTDNAIAIAAMKALERIIVVRQLPDVHAAGDFAPKVEQGEPLLLAHRPPTEPLVPTDRFVNKCGKNVEEVLVGNGKAAMQPVYPQYGLPSSVTLVAPLHQLT